MGINSLTESTETPLMSVSEVKTALENDQVELVDVRTERERDEFDIGGKHIPLIEIEDNMDYFSQSGTKVLYCATGNRSAEAIKLIKQKYPNAAVVSLKGGLKEWEAQI